MFLKNIVLIAWVGMITSSCALWPYKKDFDCPITEGLKCKSLYEISQMADSDMFGPEATNNISKCDCPSLNRKKPSSLGVNQIERCNAC